MERFYDGTRGEDAPGPVQKGLVPSSRIATRRHRREIHLQVGLEDLDRGQRNAGWHEELDEALPCQVEVANSSETGIVCRSPDVVHSLDNGTLTDPGYEYVTFNQDFLKVGHVKPFEKRYHRIAAPCHNTPTP